MHKLMHKLVRRGPLPGCGSVLAAALFKALILGVAMVSGLAVANAQSRTISFVKVVKFKPISAAATLAGATGTLSTDVVGGQLRMRLTNVAAGGAEGTQELITFVDAKTLQLNNSIIFDIATGKYLRSMKKERRESGLGGNMTDVFVYKEVQDNNRETVSEPFIEYKVADFLSVMLIAADAIATGKKKPIDLSMLRKRSVTRVQMRLLGPETISGLKGQKVHVARPDNRREGITYVMAQTKNGQFYPLMLRVETNAGLVELQGVPE